MTPSDTFALLFMLAFAGSVLGNLVAIYLLLTRPERLVLAAPEESMPSPGELVTFGHSPRGMAEIAEGLARQSAARAELDIAALAKSLQEAMDDADADANCDCGEGGVP